MRLAQLVSREITKGRLLRGLTKERLAEESGVQLRTIYRIENSDYYNVTVATIAKIINVLKIRIVLHAEDK